MRQEVKVVARTFEVPDNRGMNDDLTILAGKAAGVCYMPDDYMEKGIQDTDKAMKRAAGTARNGHHSVFDHGHITFVIKTSKMMAMLLNSIGAYTTSEKSARYTVMHPDTEKELYLYDKWSLIIKELILSRYPDMKEREADKLSIENARYMISVFTPTTMEYTISFRMVFLVADYLDRLCTSCGKLQDEFSRKVGGEAADLSRLLRLELGEQRLEDNKNQHFRFLEYQSAGGIVSAKKEVIGDSYTLVYTGSLAMLAQIQRHRTLRYSMYFDGDPLKFRYFVPAIIRDGGCKEEWLRDMHSVQYCFPQGLMVRITEQGIFEDFVLKCKERLCGRAQLEVVKNTEGSVRKFIHDHETLCRENKRLLASITKSASGEPDAGKMQACARCEFEGFKCTEGCRWGAGNTLTRLI